MCIFNRQRSLPAPPPLPPAPPPPLPPAEPVDPPNPILKDVDPQVRKAKTKRGNKNPAMYKEGTGSLRIKLDPKVNTGMDTKSGGLN
tara:strand:+ start:207 stop:467 length:261 start_codon:yes stop_codon:yes gene_type:complete